MNIGGHIFFELIYLFSLGKYSEIKLLDHIEVLDLIFKGMWIVLRGGHINLQSHQQYGRFILSPHPYRHFLFLVFFFFQMRSNQFIMLY